jgi:hypothetical protein
MEKVMGRTVGCVLSGNQRELTLNALEAKRFRELLTTLQRAEREVNVAFTILSAQWGIENATFKSLNGLGLVIEVPE